MPDAGSDQVAKKIANNKHDDAVPKGREQTSKKNDSNGKIQDPVKDRKASLSTGPTAPSQKASSIKFNNNETHDDDNDLDKTKSGTARITSSSSNNNTRPRDEKAIEAAHMLALLHTAKK